MPPSVSVQVLNYNGGNDILRCLRSLSRLDYPNFRVVVIDNASTDSSLATIEAEFPEVRIIRNSSNLGFGAGHNVGFRHILESDTEYVWLINQDAWVDPSSLSRLIQCFEATPNTGAISPLVLNPDDTPWFLGSALDWVRMRTLHLTPDPLPTQPFETDVLSGCALLLSREALKQSHGFDEQFFLYYEDTDLSLRLRKAGFSLLVAPDARVWHAETSERNLSDKVYWLVLSGLIFFRKHAHGWRRGFYSTLFLLRRLKNRLDLLVRPNAIHRSVRRAYQDFARMQF